MIKWRDVPEEIRNVTNSLAGSFPPTNPNVLMRTAKYWLENEGQDSVFFRRTIAWMCVSLRIIQKGQYSKYEYDAFIKDLDKRKNDNNKEVLK